MLSAAADCPFLPRDLVTRLEAARIAQNAELAVAASDGQTHPVIGLWSVQLRGELRHALVEEDIRKIDRWTARYKLATVTWPTTPVDPFFNANTVDDIAEADRLAELDELRSPHERSDMRERPPGIAPLTRATRKGIHPMIISPQSRRQGRAGDRRLTRHWGGDLRGAG